MGAGARPPEADISNKLFKLSQSNIPKSGYYAYLFLSLSNLFICFDYYIKPTTGVD